MCPHAERTPWVPFQGGTAVGETREEGGNCNSICTLPHQADNLTKLWQEFLSVLELIVQILCAVEVQKPSVALGNAHL